MLRAAPTPAGGQALTVAELAERLRRAGRQRNLGRRAGQLHQALASPQLAAPPVVAAAYGQAVTATVKVIGELTTQISALQPTSPAL